MSLSIETPIKLEVGGSQAKVHQDTTWSGLKLVQTLLLYYYGFWAGHACKLWGDTVGLSDVSAFFIRFLIVMNVEQSIGN